MKKLIPIVLCFAILLTVSIPSAIGATTTATPAKAFSKYSPEITLSTVRETMSTMKFPDGDSITDNVWTREIKDSLGINLEISWAIDATQYKNKLNASIASGEIPDFFACDAKTYVLLAKNNQLADLTKAYDEYATAEVKSSMTSFPEGFNSGKQKGKLVALSTQGFGTISIPAVAWIRSDWMAKYKMKAPKSFADIVKMAETFVAKKPDGQKDTYGIALSKDLYGVTPLESMEGIANAYHAYPGIWIKGKSGNIEYGSIQPEMKTTLRNMQNWYKKGLLSKEFGVKDTNKVNEDIVSGKVGINFGANWNCYWPFPDLVKKNPKAIFKPYAIPSTDSKQTYIQAAWPVDQYNVVSKNCKNPEAVVKMLNLFNKKMYHGSVKDQNKFIRSETGEELYRFGPLNSWDPTSDYKKHVNISAALASTNPSKLTADEAATYNVALTWKQKKDPNGYGAYYQMSNEGSYSVLKKFVDQKKIILTQMQGAEPPVYASKKSTLEKLEKDTFTKIILGQSISSFSTFVTNWKKIGGDAATKEINATYNNK